MGLFSRKTTVIVESQIRCTNCNHPVTFAKGVHVVKGKEGSIITDVSNLNNDEMQCPNCGRNLVARVSTVRKRVDKKNEVTD